MMDETVAVPANIHQRMLAVMRDVAYVQKGEKTVNGQYRFVGHDAVTAKIRTALVAHGIIATTDVLRHAQEGNRTEVDVMVEFINVDAPTDRVSIHAFGYGIDPQDKGPGKAISYAVKYAYLKAFALETGDDPERDSIDHDPATKPGEKKPHAADAYLNKDRPNNGAQVGKDAFDSLDTDTKDYLTQHANSIIALFEKKGDMAGFIKMQEYDMESKLALWSLLPSNVRSEIKRQQAKPALAEQG